MNVNVERAFDPYTFTGRVYWRVTECDPRSSSIKEIDPQQIQLIATSRPEEVITGVQRRNRLKFEQYVALGANVFHALNENRNLIPDSWKEEIDDKVLPVVFDGSTLEHPCSPGHVVLAFHYDRNRWCPGLIQITDETGGACRSAVLPVEYL